MSARQTMPGVFLQIERGKGVNKSAGKAPLSLTRRLAVWYIDGDEKRFAAEDRGWSLRQGNGGI
jgi:hypothetical protein